MFSYITVTGIMATSSWGSTGLKERGRTAAIRSPLFPLFARLPISIIPILRMLQVLKPSMYFAPGHYCRRDMAAATNSGAGGFAGISEASPHRPCGRLPQGGCGHNAA